MTPTLYLTSAAAVGTVAKGSAMDATRKTVGPGRVHGIMRWPPAWADEMCGGRRVISLMPTKLELEAANTGAICMGSYALLLARRWLPSADPGPWYGPGSLSWGTAGAIDGAAWDGQGWTRGQVVESGDTLVCACALGSMLCHRRVAASVLLRAGWDVVLDGVRFPARSRSHWIAVCGGRDLAREDFDDRPLGLERQVQAVGTGRPLVLVHGCCGNDGEYRFETMRGADRWGDVWATAHEDGLVFPVPADWRTGGTAAGPLRNRRIAIEVRPDVLFAYPGGAGTAGMAREAEAAGVAVRFVQKRA